MRRINYYLIILLLFSYCLEASAECQQWVAKVVSVQGRVEMQRPGSSKWLNVDLHATLCPGDKIRTSRNSRTTLELGNKSLATLDQKTTLVFSKPVEKSFSQWLDLLKGSTFFRSRQPHKLEIRTPFVNAVHEGTEFLVSVGNEQAELLVFEGQVNAVNKSANLPVNKGYKAVAAKGQALRIVPITIRPEDAVQWTLYYPPLLDYQNLPTAAITPATQDSIALAQQGEIFLALETLNKVPENHRSSQYEAIKASLYLQVGRVHEAEKAIDLALSLDSHNSNAIALQSIIAITKNQPNTAFDLATRAVMLDTDSGVAQMALSYAFQAKFEIEPALEAAQQAVQLSPNNALAWSRLAELQLSVGERRDAHSSAEKAEALNPALAKTHIILGFAKLAQIDIDAAKDEFTEAIALDSADPLARLGLGLAKIRKGALQEGTRDLETAVSLDPDNSIARSYLGKAYYELKNKTYAINEFDLAKQLDPNDPTPWFYDAILKQTINRPVEALQDMQQAIELNANRGIYRSKLLLDEDLASRSANLARIYDNLDFDRVALKEAWNSINWDTTNYSAHRFLADAYVDQSGFRIARASELLQAQLLQPINITPIQPQIAGNNIAFFSSSGPSSLTTNEYNPLFTSNGASLLVNGIFGSNNTIGDNAIISGIYNKLSLSFGQNFFKTDGFQTNDDYKQELYNAFVQYAITPDFNVQAEIRREYINAGDVTSRINGFHRDNLRQTIDQNTARVGLNFKIDPRQEVLFSGFYTSFSENERNIRKEPGLFEDVRIHDNSDFDKTGFQGELQYIFHPEFMDLTVGMGYLRLNSKNTQREQIEFTLGDFDPEKVVLHQEFITNYINGYLYSNYQVLSNLTSILGVSVDSYDDDLIDTTQINPKIGFIWNPVDQLTFRFAAFRTFKRPMVASQTIEPTQIAGFNQFFDENDATRAWRYGIGADYTLFKNFFVGAELSWRNVTTPITSVNKEEHQRPVFFQDRDEAAHLAYIYWTPIEWFSFSSEYRFNNFNREYEIDKLDPSNPQSVKTHLVPITFNFFHSSGLFANFTSNYINQTVKFVEKQQGLDETNVDFWTFDTSIGYRLPKRYGIISLDVNNLFNKNFLFQSNVDASGPQLAAFVPEREIFFKFNVTF